MSSPEHGTLNLLLDKIEAAFGDLHVPDESRLVLGASLEGETIRRKYRNRHWLGLSMIDLAGEADSLSFFTPEAFRFFLPAFMKAALVDPQKADLIPDAILWLLAKCDCIEYWNERRADIIETANAMGVPDDLVQAVLQVESSGGPIAHPAWPLFTKAQKEAVLSFVLFLKQWRKDEFTPGELECVEQVLLES